MPPKKRAANGAPAVKQSQKKKKASSPNGDDSGLDQMNNDEIEDDVEYEDILLEGSMISGELLFCGGTNWDLVGRKTLPKGIKTATGRNLYEPHRLTCMKGIRVRSVISGCGACYSVVITTEGRAYSWGRNDKAQLGQGDTLRRDNPTLMESLQGFNIVDAACGKSHTLLLSEKGITYACGDNTMGQLGLGLQSPSVPSPTQIRYGGPPIRRVSCAIEFSMIVNVKGHLLSFGCPEYGQLGHNTDGKYFVSNNKLAYRCETRPRRVPVFIEKTREGHIMPIEDVNVQDIACGNNHTVVLDDKKRVFTFGFGGYGRLGHAEQKDQMVPRLVQIFQGLNRGAIRIAAGSAFSMAVNELGTLYLWGQNKPSGEAAMYPKQVQDLCGWKVRSIGCGNRSVVVAADDSVISWGPSPTYGELGYGANKPKSSTTPLDMKPLNKIYVHKVACGYGHTLMVARCDTDEDNAALDELPDYEP